MKTAKMYCCEVLAHPDFVGFNKKFHERIKKFEDLKNEFESIKKKFGAPDELAKDLLISAEMDLDAYLEKLVFSFPGMVDILKQAEKDYPDFIEWKFLPLKIESIEKSGILDRDDSFVMESLRVLFDDRILKVRSVSFAARLTIELVKMRLNNEKAPTSEEFLSNKEKLLTGTDYYFSAYPFFNTEHCAQHIMMTMDLITKFISTGTTINKMMWFDSAITLRAAASSLECAILDIQEKENEKDFGHRESFDIIMDKLKDDMKSEMIKRKAH